MKMKSSTIWTCASVLLFVQLIDCRKDSILSSFVEKFKKKALKNEVNVGSSLDFVVQFSNTIDKVNKKLEVRAHEFMNNKKLEQIILRIPSDLTVMVFDPIEANAREVIQNSVTLINRALKVNIPNAKNKVRSEISFRPSIRYDKVLEKWSKVWEYDPKDSTKY
ncbi:uncharacterized protein LOC116341264 [Contarinia nasturtii]|uniref:uncharacterized protein LOC116341264 n=1 Tax=Contarinia nasturtii TaxID=265458 RepID=UPI0012D49FFA|nr:uncharacterized protein LOC116341264 [Contarinia nasturtii]